MFMPVRYVVAPQNNAFCKLLAFPVSFQEDFFVKGASVFAKGAQKLEL